MPQFVELSHYPPILLTVISAAFAWVILARYRLKPQSYHLLWWGIGIVTYGLGTLIHSLVMLLGWQAALFKAWYIAGALLGGAPLAIGGTGSRMGRTESLYIGEIIYLILIWIGYKYCQQPLDAKCFTSSLSR